MRLLLLASQYPPVVGGAEMQAERLARAFVAAGIQVTVLTQPYPGHDLEDSNNGVRIVRGLWTLSLGPVWGLTYMRSAAVWLRRLRSQWDVLHNQQIGLDSWVGVRVANDLRKASLLRVAAVGAKGDLHLLRRRRFGARFIAGLHGAGRIVSLTRDGAAEIASFGLPAERIRVIPNGIDLSGFQSRSWARIEASEPVRLLFVGRLAAQKGVDVLLRALALVDYPSKFRLRIIGIGEDQEKLRELARREALDHVVEFCGVRHDMVSEYAWSELVVLPSRYEGMPNVVLEAMACARPVLGTRVVGTADLIEEDINGWLVPMEDPQALAEALVRVSARRHLLESLGREGRRMVEARYSIDRVASMYIQEYEALLAEQSARS